MTEGIPALPRDGLQPYAACWAPRRRPIWIKGVKHLYRLCHGTMRPVENEAGETIALRCSACGFLAAGDGRLTVRRGRR
jgi:hypothetical protein